MFSVTRKAQDKLKEVLPSSEAAVRIGAVRGPHGCIHGWRLSIEESVEPRDLVHTVGEIRLVVEPELFPVIEDAEIDYAEDSSGIGFTVDAPGAQSHGHGHGGEGGCQHH